MMSQRADTYLSLVTLAKCWLYSLRLCILLSVTLFISPTKHVEGTTKHVCFGWRLYTQG